MQKVDGMLFNQIDFELLLFFFEHWLIQNEDGVKKMSEIVSDLATLLSERCLCEISPSLFGLMQFKCSKNDKVMIIQGRLLGLPTINSSELLADMQEWVNSGPSMVVDGIQLNIQEQCTVIINSLNSSTECTPATGAVTSSSVKLATSLLSASTPTPAVTSSNSIAVAVGSVGGVLAFLLIAIAICVILYLVLKRAIKTITKWDTKYSSWYYNTNHFIMFYLNSQEKCSAPNWCQPNV